MVRGVVGGDQLLHLALGDDGRGGGEDVEHAQAAVGDHELEGAAEQEVADQHRRLVAPDRVGGGRAAAQAAVVDHVVVQQRGGVDELDAGGERQLARAAIAAQARGQQGQDRPHPLAAGGDDVAGQLGDQADLALHPVEDDLVDLVAARRRRAPGSPSSFVGGALRRQGCCGQRGQAASLPGTSDAAHRRVVASARLLTRTRSDSKPHARRRRRTVRMPVIGRTSSQQRSRPPVLGAGDAGRRRDRVPAGRRLCQRGRGQYRRLPAPAAGARTTTGERAERVLAEAAGAVVDDEPG